jgi:hypothetical protein
MWNFNCCDAFIIKSIGTNVSHLPKKLFPHRNGSFRLTRRQKIPTCPWRPQKGKSQKSSAPQRFIYAKLRLRQLFDPEHLEIKLTSLLQFYLPDWIFSVNLRRVWNKQ